MVLDLTRDLDEWQIFSSPREARVDMRNSYDEDRWRGQPSFPIFIVDKDTMEPVCRPMAQGCALVQKSHNAQQFAQTAIQRHRAAKARERLCGRWWLQRRVCSSSLKLQTISIEVKARSAHATEAERRRDRGLRPARLTSVV